MKIAVLTILMIFCVRSLERQSPLSCLIPRTLGPILPSISLEEAHNLIRAAALKHKVPAAFVKSIVAAESNFNQAAVSSKGAIGLMQLMPETAEQYGVDPTNAAENIDGGTRYLGVLMRRYQKSRDWLKRTIAAYNAGPGMVDKYRGVPPFHETRVYVARVLSYLKQFEKES